MDVRARLQTDLKEALRARDERRKSAIRMALSAIQLAEVEHDGELDQAGLIAVLRREVKQRQESIADYRRANQPERAAEEEAELAILETYLPQMMSRDEIVAEVRAVIDEVGASGAKDMGAVMRVIMPRLQGRADGRQVNEVVRELLAG